MAGDPLQEAHARTVEWQAAFIQGIAASAIAFGIHETADREPAFSLIPIGVALILWSGSFAAGVINNHARQRAIAANIAENMARSMSRGDLVDTAGETFDRSTRLAGRAYTCQLSLLLVGAIAYLMGHGIHIWENKKPIPLQAVTPKPAPPPGTPSALHPAPPVRKP